MDDPGIASLNRQYRNRDQATNVLAFSMGEGEGGFISQVLGDIVISLDTAMREALEEGIHIKDRVLRLLAHGLLHLLGLDHEKEQEATFMESREEEILRVMEAEYGKASC